MKNRFWFKLKKKKKSGNSQLEEFKPWHMLFSTTHPCVNLPNRQTLALAHDQMHSASAAVSLPCCHSNHFPLHLIGRAGLLFSGHADMSHMQCAEWLPRARRMTVFSHISICLQPLFPLDCLLDKPKTLKFYWNKDFYTTFLQLYCIS